MDNFQTYLKNASNKTNFDLQQQSKNMWTDFDSNFMTNDENEKNDFGKLNQNVHNIYNSVFTSESTDTIGTKTIGGNRTIQSGPKVYF